MRVFDELTRRAPRVVMRVASGAGRLQETTRDEVLELAERGSRGLRALGVGPGDRVAVRMERGKWQTSAFLAAWCIGACVVPLFELLGSEALAARLEQSGAKLQLDRSSWEPLARGEGEMAGAAPEGTFEWDAPLALLFTSGTTGRPKGVAVTPRSLASTEAYLSHGLALQSGEETRFCNASDPAWAYGLYYNLLGPLWSGATVHHLAVNAPLTALTDLKLTDLAAAPSFYGLLSRADVNLPDLHRCSSAGESMGSALHARWKVTDNFLVALLLTLS
jgi:acetyl-CoA synthetase